MAYKNPHRYKIVWDETVYRWRSGPHREQSLGTFESLEKAAYAVAVAVGAHDSEPDAAWRVACGRRPTVSRQ